MNEATARKIRAKKLGVLIRDARKHVTQSPEECAQAMGITTEAYEAYELGTKSPSLPELELLSFFLKVPLEHFWSDGAQLLEAKKEEGPVDPKRLIPLRQKVIGVLLRKARLEKDLTLDQLAESSNIEAERLEAYELGQVPIPLPELDLLAAEFDSQLKVFLDVRGPAGKWLAQQRFLNDFMSLSPELQDFVCKPVNRPYIEVAQRLSEMSADKLRNVAEVLLEITL
jgi:transcriptional regulator with XRE-family HTH domain